MVGSTLGPYRIREKLGAGGMGEVYRAHDARLNRDVAIKVLPPDLAADPARRHGLLREARAAAALASPHIAVVHAVDEVEGVTFIAMELLPGGNLSDRLRAERLPVWRGLELASQLASGLAVAHEHGLVHRDVKPGNIMFDEHGQAKLIDFGLAKLREPAAPDDATTSARQDATAPGMLMGTVAYMSPEQARGATVDARTDTWSLGVVLYELLAGRRPYAGASTMEVLAAILRDPVPPLPETPTLSAPVAAECTRVLEKCLAKDPELRYQNVRDAELDLRAIRQRVLSPAHHGAVEPAPHRVWHRRSARMVLGFGLLLLIMVGWLAVGRGGWAPTLAFGFQERDWVLVADLENLTGDADFDRSLDAALTIGIQQSRYVNVVPASRVRETLERMNQADAARLDEALASDVAQRLGVKGVVAAGLSLVGQTYSVSLRVVDPHTHLAVVAETSQARGKDEVLPVLDGLVTRVRERLGESLSSLSQTNRPLPEATTSSISALKLYADALRRTGKQRVQLLEQAVALDSDFALAHAQLGLWYYLENERARGEEHFVRALSLQDRLTLRERLWVQALAEDTRGDREQGAERFEAYLASYPDDAYAWFRLGWTNMAVLGRPERAMEAFRRVLTLEPESGNVRVNLAGCYVLLRRYPEAVEEYERAFELAPDLMFGEYVNHEFGFTLVRVGQVDRARDVFTRALAQPDRGMKARARRSLGLLEMYRGRYAAAADHLREAVLFTRAEGWILSELRNLAYLWLVERARAHGGLRPEEHRRIDTLVEENSFAPGGLLSIGRLQAREGMIRDAMRTVERMRAGAEDVLASSSITRNSPGDEAAIATLEGEIALARGLAAEAVIGLEGAVLDYLPARGPLAAAYARLGQVEQAVRHYEKLITTEPLGAEMQEDFQHAHLELARIYEQGGERVKARALAQRLLDRWRDADPDLPLLAETRAFVERIDAVR